MRSTTTGSENLLHPQNLRVPQQSVTSRSVNLTPSPSSIGAIDKTKEADVFIVRSTLGRLDTGGSNTANAPLSWHWNSWKSIIRKLATHSRFTHWALEIRGNLYEIYRHPEIKGFWRWRATCKITTTEQRRKNLQQNVVEKIKIGRTFESDWRIAQKAYKYERYYRRYSAFGDNCQQFLLRFCTEIELDKDPNAFTQLSTATSLANVLKGFAFFTTLFFIADILFLSKGRFSIASPLLAGAAFTSLVLMSLVHPRFFLVDFLPLDVIPSFIVQSGLNVLVFVAWIFVPIVLCFSFENACDHISIRVVDGVEVFNVWNSCNLALRGTQLIIAILSTAGLLYYGHYTSHFLNPWVESA